MLEPTLYFLLYMDYKAECQRMESEPFEFAEYIGWLLRGGILSQVAQLCYLEGLTNG